VVSVSALLSSHCGSFATKIVHVLSKDPRLRSSAVRFVRLLGMIKQSTINGTLEQLLSAAMNKRDMINFVSTDKCS